MAIETPTTKSGERPRSKTNSTPLLDDIAKRGGLLKWGVVPNVPGIYKAFEDRNRGNKITRLLWGNKGEPIDESSNDKPRITELRDTSPGQPFQDEKGTEVSAKDRENLHVETKNVEPAIIDFWESHVTNLLRLYSSNPQLLDTPGTYLHEQWNFCQQLLVKADNNKGPPKFTREHAKEFLKNSGNYNASIIYMQREIMRMQIASGTMLVRDNLKPVKNIFERFRVGIKGALGQPPAPSETYFTFEHKSNKALYQALEEIRRSPGYASERTYMMQMYGIDLDTLSWDAGSGQVIDHAQSQATGRQVVMENMVTWTQTIELFYKEMAHVAPEQIAASLLERFIDENGAIRPNTNPDQTGLAFAKMISNELTDLGGTMDMSQADRNVSASPAEFIARFTKAMENAVGGTISSEIRSILEQSRLGDEKESDMRAMTEQQANIRRIIDKASAYSAGKADADGKIEGEGVLRAKAKETLSEQKKALEELNEGTKASDGTVLEAGLSAIGTYLSLDASRDGTFGKELSTTQTSRDKVAEILQYLDENGLDISSARPDIDDLSVQNIDKLAKEMLKLVETSGAITTIQKALESEKEKYIIDTTLHIDKPVSKGQTPVKEPNKAAIDDINAQISELKTLAGAIRAKAQELMRLKAEIERNRQRFAEQGEIAVKASAEMAKFKSDYVQLTGAVLGTIQDIDSQKKVLAGYPKGIVGVDVYDIDKIMSAFADPNTWPATEVNEQKHRARVMRAVVYAKWEAKCQALETKYSSDYDNWKKLFELNDPTKTRHIDMWEVLATPPSGIVEIVDKKASSSPFTTGQATQEASQAQRYERYRFAEFERARNEVIETNTKLAKSKQKELEKVDEDFDEKEKTATEYARFFSREKAVSVAGSAMTYRMPRVREHGAEVDRGLNNGTLFAILTSPDKASLGSIDALLTQAERELMKSPPFSRLSLGALRLLDAMFEYNSDEKDPKMALFNLYEVLTKQPGTQIEELLADKLLRALPDVKASIDWTLVTAGSGAVTDLASTGFSKLDLVLDAWHAYCKGKGQNTILEKYYLAPVHPHTAKTHEINRVLVSVYDSLTAHVANNVDFNL